MKKFLLASIVVGCAVTSVKGQAPNIVSYTLDTFAQGATSPMQSTPYQSTSIACNQVAPTVPTSVTNPTKFFFDDAANVGKVCIGTLGGTWLQAIPNGPGYYVTLTQTDNIGNTSARSAGSNPFVRQGNPAVVTNVRVIP